MMGDLNHMIGQRGDLLVNRGHPAMRNSIPDLRSRD